MRSPLTHFSALSLRTAFPHASFLFCRTLALPPCLLGSPIRSTPPLRGAFSPPPRGILSQPRAPSARLPAAGLSGPARGLRARLLPGDGTLLAGRGDVRPVARRRDATRGARGPLRVRKVQAQPETSLAVGPTERCKSRHPARNEGWLVQRRGAPRTRLEMLLLPLGVQ